MHPLNTPVVTHILFTIVYFECKHQRSEFSNHERSEIEINHRFLLMKLKNFILRVVHKLRLQDEVEVGGPKMSTFCQRLYHRIAKIKRPINVESHIYKVTK